MLTPTYGVSNPSLSGWVGQVAGGDLDERRSGMTKTLFGACGNEGCLDCEPAYVVVFDGGERQYPVTFTYEMQEA